jgi:hypothetical protein
MEAATTLQISPTKAPPDESVAVDAGVVSITQLRIEDPTLAELVETRDQRGIAPSDTIKDAIEIGARVLDREATGAEVDLIKREFAELEHGFAEQARKITEQLDERLEKFLGEEGGAMGKALESHADEMAGQLAELFGEGRSTAVQHQIRDILSRALGDSQKELLRQFSAEDGHNPLADFKGSVIRQMEGAQLIQKEQVDRLAALEGEVKRLHDAEAAGSELAAERDRGTSKGRDFEQRAFELVERMAIARGDVAQHVGDESSGSGSKKGDIVIEIDAAAGPAKSRIVLELKDQKLTKNQAWELLDTCLVEREADFALLVVGSDDKLPAGRDELHEYQGNKMIVVLDREQPDERGLFLAYAHARLRCLVSTEKELQLDAAGVRDAADEAFTALKTAQAIRNSLTKAEKGVSGARDGLDAMVERVEASLNRVESLITS